MVENGKGDQEQRASWKAPELDDEVSPPVQLNISLDNTGQQPAFKRPSVIIKDPYRREVAWTDHAREMLIIPPKPTEQKRKPENMEEKRKEEILKGLAIDTPESRKKIADIILFNIRGLRTNQNLAPRDFGSLQELDSVIKTLSLLQGEGDFTAMIIPNKKGELSIKSIRDSKIVSIPLSDFTVQGRSTEANLQIKFVQGEFGSGNFEVIGIEGADKKSVWQRAKGMFGK